MRQRKAQAKKPQAIDINEVLNQYDTKTLLTVLNSFENNIAWEVFKSFIYYQAAVHGTMSNVLIQQSGKIMEACAAGAKAEVLREVTDKFMDILKSKVVRDDGVLESPLPEEQ